MRVERSGVPGNEPWKIERNGINVVADVDKSDRPVALFWIWFAANIGILGVLYGAMIVSFRLNLFQSLLAAAIGASSFLLVGLLSVAGRDGAAPMLALSRAVFGAWGNLLPTMVSWINLLGWETVIVITGALALQALLQSVFAMAQNSLSLSVSIAIFAGCAIVFALFGQATIALIQKIASWAFGLLTVAVIAELLSGTPWHTVIARPAGDWLTGFLPAVSVVIAGAGISWGNAAADYSRYQERTSSSGAIVLMVTLGGAIPLFVLMATGILLAGRLPDLVSAANPIAALEHALPRFMRTLYLLTAVGGLAAEADMSLYSSGLNLLTLGVHMKRYKSIVIDAAVMMSLSLYILFVQQDFIGALEAFVTLVGIGLGAWEAVFLAHQVLIRRRYGKRARPPVARWWALISWGAGIVIGLLFTSSPFWNGPLAKGIFSQNSLGVLLAFMGSFTLYAIVLHRCSTPLAAQELTVQRARAAGEERDGDVDDRIQ